MLCPQCQHENREGARFCSECGAAFPIRCAACGAVAPPGSKYCDCCGEIWEAVEAPASLIDAALELPARLEEAQRQLAMLRLLLARDRAVDEEAPASIPLRRAA